MDDHISDVPPSGALVPPPRRPPTALATFAPLSPPRRATDAAAATGRGTRFVRLLNAALDELDVVGDRIAHEFGVR